TLWDIAGQEKFKIIRKGFFEGARGALVMYDVTRRSTFENIKNWINEVEEFAGEIPMIICGNKIDLVDQREVKREEGENFSKKIGKMFIETSAKTGQNVEKAFVELCSQIKNTVK
ncbi:MAG: GTP-binding protein, partial [Candidatus Odinarchaeia archaeon]